MDSPREFPAGTTPEQAADQLSDVLGFMAIVRVRHSAAQAQREGRGQDQAFYEAVLAILLQWKAEQDTRDEELEAELKRLGIEEPPADLPDE